MIIFVRPRTEPDVEARLGITATRKVGNAVVRNRMRRMVREAFRRHRHDIPPWNVVVNVHAKAVTARAEQIEQELVRLLDRARRKLSNR